MFSAFCEVYVVYRLFILVFILFSCHKYTEKNTDQYLSFQGIANKEVLLSKINLLPNGKKDVIPLQRVYTNTKIPLPAGRYLLSNDCTSYEFNQNEGRSTQISLSHLRINLKDQAINTEEIKDDNQVVQTLCYNVVNQKEYAFDKRLDFDILPGKNNIFISGKNLNYDIPPNSSENLSYELLPISLISSLVDRESPRFFVVAQDELYEKKKVVLSAPLNGKIWLFPGKYSLEINGSKKQINLDEKGDKEYKLGTLKISSPKNFPFDKRMQQGGQPISAFIDDKVLIRLNSSYPVFAGKYFVNLDDSDLEKEVEIFENKTTEVKTVGSQINAPECTSRVSNCYTPSKITIHENQQPFILMVVPVGEPFLVFAENIYQYGVEGVKGIFKTLPTSSDSVRTETLGLVNMKWEVRYTTSNNTTDFVRFESKSSNLFGKSVDLSFFKPNDVYLPEGSYWLTYYVGDASNQNVPKTRTEVDLSYGSVKNLTIPLYVHGVRDLQKENESNFSNTTQSTTLAPIKK